MILIGVSNVNLLLGIQAFYYNINAMKKNIQRAVCWKLARDRSQNRAKYLQLLFWSLYKRNHSVKKCVCVCV